MYGIIRKPISGGTVEGMVKLRNGFGWSRNSIFLHVNFPRELFKKSEGHKVVKTGGTYPDVTIFETHGVNHIFQINDIHDNGETPIWQAINFPSGKFTERVRPTITGISIDPSECIRCDACIDFCEFMNVDVDGLAAYEAGLLLQDGEPGVRQPKPIPLISSSCTLCAKCKRSCPVDAIAFSIDITLLPQD